MDCCNYMQYRHHQPYYANQYYDPLPPYHGDFYGHHMYQDYYGNSPYYNPSQQWCNTNQFPSDYAYNPKDARIRKAMRDASRERTSIGASPMLPRPNARRVPQSWMAPQEDILMGPMNARGIENSLCGFPMPPGNNSFISQMNPNYKMEPPQPPANYLQTNPLAQLQQHTEMWHEYHAMRPRTSTSGAPYMMSEVPSFHPQPPDLRNAMPRRIPSPNNLQRTISSPSQPHANKNVPPTPITSGQGTAVPTEDLLDKNADFNGKLDPNPDFIPVFNQQNGQQHFENVDDQLKGPLAPQIHNSTKKPANNKPLPDFNEAFGSTERGRFQSPPDPRLAPNKGYLDYFLDSNQIKFDNYQI